MKKHRLVSAIVAAGCLMVVAGLYAFATLHDGQSTPTGALTDALFGWKYPVAKFPSTGLSGNLAYSDIRDPGGVPQGLPVRLRVPSIGVDSAIEDALITPDGRMDVPAGSVNVAWFALGPHPGQTGSAVIGGHFGISKGVPFVFYNLDKLRVGDTVDIIDDEGTTLTFVVRFIKSFDRNADATTVFTSDDGLAHLNLITCEGIWNQVNGTYPERLVVFTDLVSLADPAPTAPAGPTAVSPASSFNRSLAIGTRGADVVALQNVLESKGFLLMPPGVAKGFFGTLTKAALTRYQTSVGLPAVGVFGPLTRAKLAQDAGSISTLPDAGTLGTSARSAATPPASPERFTEGIASLYATPLDALITLLLLAVIGFVGFTLVRRQP